MSRKRIYHPSETHLALHPPRTLIDCPCGVRFAARLSPSPDIDSEDDPKLCLTCNRRAWSRLWNDNQPVKIKAKNDIVIDSDPEHASDDYAFDLTSDTDIGEVISIKRGKR